MINISQINDWGSLHPLVVHFPIALLFVAPLFIALGLITHPLRKAFYICALILMLLGTAGVFCAVSTGDSAAEPLSNDPAVTAVLNSHVRFAEQARLNFSALAILFLFHVTSRTFIQKRLGKFDPAVVLIFLIIYALNLALVFNTAHYGGKLVHQHGIKSALYLDPPNK